ncbi:16S rRNA (guanine(966)-N(2))-methyltransferase RsmD [Paraglaciecola aquimarina]|uniref:Ribosomal RNA small subunit methyltransferase D n=1 Tax=Paraglaciecola aquimarina TaxID=1235557 RepID=A0ABU3SUL8_9ALTE|nr:16S rRNA (guanine(966)-N(2))-methyltransferase RsmD [Paraglaciecola aquimarina]MDU0353688.1 16S rRNA (guanine(966)-N(2))-methyltransferase RsmD [Paraglaciecola aquimarina]
MKRGVKTIKKANGAIRIISGRWRGRKLPVLDVQGLRPTTDRNKETLFNWLMPYTTEAKCLDVFAGSGGLGFEALSRYAASATFIELDKKAASNIAENIKLLDIKSEQVALIQGNALRVLDELTEPFDLIFLDPPFNKNLLADVVNTISAQNLLAPDGVIYIECEGQGGNYIVPQDWQLIKEKQTSQVQSRLYRRQS